MQVWNQRTESGHSWLEIGARVVFTALLSLFTGTAAFAEGSRTLFPAVPAPAFRADLDLTADTAATVPYVGVTQRRQFIYVYANAGEYILFGSSNRNNGGDVLVFNPQSFGTKGAETIPATADFQCSVNAPAGSFGGGTLGNIAARTNELAGPNSADNSQTVANGYAPCAYLAPSTGIYGVKFTVATSGGSAPTGSVATLHVGNATVAAWDVTVRATATSLTDINARVFTYALVAFTGGNSRPLNHTLFYATLDGQRYQQTMQAFDPNGYALWGSGLGFLDNGQPLYKDIRGGNAQVAPGSGQFVAELAAQQPQTPIFFSSISPTDVNASQAQTVLQALGIPLTPPTPQLSNVAFNGQQSGNTTYLGSGGTFTFTTQNDTSYQIVISADGVDFDPANPANATITGLAPNGSNSVQWNGSANNGTAFPVGTFNFRIVGRNGEIHFPIVDDEGNSVGGPTLTKLNGANAGDNVVFFDDRGYITRNQVTVGTLNGALCAAATPTPPTPDHSLLGVDSSLNTFTGPNCASGACYYRYWPANGNSNSDCATTAGFGDAKALDLWSFQQTPDTNAQIVIVTTPAAAQVATSVSVPPTAFPGTTVNGSLSFQNVGGTTATGVTYTTTIGTPGNCPTNLVFPLVPAGVTFTYDSATCIVTFAGMPTTLATNAVLNFNFSYTAPASGTVPVNTTIDSTNGGTANASGVTQIIVSDVLTTVSVPMTAAEGSTVSGTITYGNSASATTTANGIAYTATIGTPGSCPANVAFPNLPVGVTASYNSTSCQVTFNGMPSSLTPGQSVPIDFTYTAPSSNATIPVTSGISTTTPETSTANNTANGSTAVSTPNITLSKQGPATATQGVAFTYTIGLGNSSATASGLTLTVDDQLPAGIVANSVAPGAGVSAVNCGTLPSASGAALTCTLTLSAVIPPTSANGAATFTINATANATGSLINYASVDPTGGPTPPTPGPGCNTSSCGNVTTVVAAATDLSITKTDGATSYTPGNTVVYTIVASNGGPTAVTGASVTDPLPANIVSSTWTCVGAAGGTCTASGSGGISDLVNLPVGGSVTYTLSMDVPANFTGNLTNVASVAPPTGVVDTNPANNTATDTDTQGAQPDLTIAKSHAGNFTQGQIGATYSIVVSNVGGAPSTGLVSVVEQPPTGITPTAISGNGWACTLNTLTCTRSDALAPTAAYPAITLTVDVAANAPATVTNVAVVSGGGDPNPSNNTATDPATIVTVVQPPVLTITKTGPSTATAGGTITYSILVTNTGTGTATNATLADIPPQSLTFVSAGAPCTGGLPCNLGTLTPGQSVTVSATFTVAAGFSGTIVNTASVTSDQTTVVTSTATTIVTTGTTGGTTNVPIDARWMLLAMIGLLAAAGLRRSRARR